MLSREREAAASASATAELVPARSSAPMPGIAASCAFSESFSSASAGEKSPIAAFMPEISFFSRFA